ncbi:40s ribosomal protein S10 [Cryptosporidium andersoni]|uniref:40s ribosomal protein S10 n=1 Tax=Cryptosporidium andersoni TaxID=117008 RepID=A0A1J4MVM2_9CRYT|nr:40s ribosomal protein S10 [Cryptosporidium andersoni]
MSSYAVCGSRASLVPKKNQRAIYSYLFKEGVIVVHKNPNDFRHSELDISNLQVMLTMRSLLSKEVVTEKFTWQHNYYFLTDEGIEYLRRYLDLPASVFPATHTKKTIDRPGRSEGHTLRGYGRNRQHH